MSDQVRVNGVLFSRASCQLKMEGEPFYGWTAIEYGDKRERAYGYGAGRHGGPRGITKGKYTPDPLVLTVFSDTADAIRSSLAKRASDGKSYGEPAVLWTLSISEPGLTSVLVELEGCVFSEDSGSAEDSADPLSEKLTFMPMRVKRNGRSLYDQSVAGSGA